MYRFWDSVSGHADWTAELALTALSHLNGHDRSLCMIFFRPDITCVRLYFTAKLLPLADDMTAYYTATLIYC